MWYVDLDDFVQFYVSVFLMIMMVDDEEDGVVAINGW